MNDAPQPNVRGASKRRHRLKLRRRDVIAPMLAIGCLLLSQVLFGATETKSTLLVSGCLIITAMVAIALAGPRLVTPAILITSAGLLIYGVSGLAGPLDRAIPDLAALFAAGSIWTVGYIAARRRADIRVVLGGLVWASLAYAIWYFFVHVSGGAPTVETGAATEDSILFGLFALIGSSRVLHVIKQLEAESLSRSELIDRLLRDGLGGLLLIGFSITCLLLVAPRVSLLFIASVLLLHGWWDTRVLTRHGAPAESASWMSGIAPLAAIALAALGGALSFMSNTSGARDLEVDRLLHLDRLYAYGGAWIELPVFGNGLGSIEVVGARIMSIWNADALMAPGGAQNALLHMLVEIGVAGTAVILLTLIVMHMRILAGMADRKAPRSMMRLALAAGVLLTLNGAFCSSLDTPGVIWLYALLLGVGYGLCHGVQSASQTSAAPAPATVV